MELHKAPDLLNDTAEIKPSSNAFVREAQLIWQGVSATPEYLQKSLSPDEREQTAKTAIFSAGLTLALSCLRRSPSLAWTAGRILAPALAIPLLNDLDSRTRQLGETMSDNWNSDRNWTQNVSVARENIGKFSADFAISALSSGLAERAGRSYFGLQTPGVNRLPELNREGLISNWQKHMAGEIVPYKIFSENGGGMRQVDLFIPKNLSLPEVAASPGSSNSGLLIAQDGLKLDFGRLKDLSLPDSGLINLRADKSMDYVAAFTHPHRFRVIPGVNLSAWHHESGLIKKGGWFAPEAHNDAAFLTDLEKTLTSTLKTNRTVLAGYSSGAIINNEVAAKLGPERIPALVSAASTVTGLEPAASVGQFRLVVRDLGDPTLLQDGGAGGKAKILANLGHKAVLNSVPEGQIGYGLKPYQGQEIITHEPASHPETSVQKFVSNEGSPLMTYIKTNEGRHIWTTSPIAPAGRAVDSVSTLSAIPPQLDQVGLNQMVKEIVNGNLHRFGS